MNMRLRPLLSAILIAFGIIAGGTVGHADAASAGDAAPADDWEWD
ncbi:hypothetical protein [Glycomyces xiaoerkulensis]|nr:hypothetical protein [Glycomyces xiaoerkulensis]